MDKMRQKGISAIGIVIVAVILAVVASVGGYVVLRGVIGGGLPSGTASITLETEPPFTPSGFDFSAGIAPENPAQHDFGFEQWYAAGQAAPGIIDYSSIGYVTGPSGVRDMGPTDLDSVTTAPETGYLSYYENVSIAHVYVIKCQENTYAKILITNISFADGGYPATITFDWVYQPNGSRNF